MLTQDTARIVQSASGAATLTSANSKHKVALTRVTVNALHNCSLCTLALDMLAHHMFARQAPKPTAETELEERN